jgi:PhnB protein
MQVCVYLNFDGDTEEAMAFYHQALGGTLGELHRFSSMPSEPGQELPPELASRVMHQTLQLTDSQMIMASDTFPGMGPPHIVGTNASISVHPDSREQADQIFAALSEGGTVTMPLADQFWGDYFGSVTDRYGVQWMLNFNPAGTQG